jgi:hypothetical protein
MNTVKNWPSEKYIAIAWAWLILISLLTLLKIAPEGLNADILMNSVMSLQNLTLYYWGQNRLLNILPLMVSFIKDPALNLTALLALSAVSFYGFLYILTIAASVLIIKKNNRALVLHVFVISSCAFIFIFSPHAISEITIGHIEYSFPSLLLVYASLKIFRRGIGVEGWLQLIIPVFALGLAIGINPSTIIPAFFISFSIAVYKKRFELNAKLFLLVSIASFIIWDFISKSYGGFSYNQFEVEILNTGLYKVLIGLLDVINLPILLIIIISIAIAKVAHQIFQNQNEADSQPIIRYATKIVIIFVISWFLLFASSRWVEMNGYAWRYFVYVINVIIFIFMLNLFDWLRVFEIKYSNILAGLIAIISIVFLTPDVDRVKFESYKVFQRVNELTEEGSSLYAGDYWLVWPSVLRDMMIGYEAYGLTFRGDANKNAARDYMLKIIKEKGRAKVYCLDESIPRCTSQVNDVAGPLYAVDASLIKDKVSLVEFVENASFLEFKGADFLSLPSQIGIVNGLERRSQSSAGFMIYGPYVPIKPGKYFLSVLGSSAQLKDAYIDVVSDRGAKVYAKIALKDKRDDYLARNVEIDLAGVINDLEVRVWVGENDEIKLYGYSLKPFEIGCIK